MGKKFDRKLEEASDWWEDQLPYDRGPYIAPDVLVYIHKQVQKADKSNQRQERTSSMDPEVVRIAGKIGLM